MTASPPWAVTTAAISGVSVATATRPISASFARRSTCTIMGAPAMSISGLPGRREDAMRAGISTKVRGSDIRTRLENLSELLGVVVTQAHIYGLPEHGQTDISSAAWGAQTPMPGGYSR